jgi:hypothetical protein
MKTVALSGLLRAARCPKSTTSIGCPETSARSYHYLLCNNPEERGLFLPRGGRLTSPSWYDEAEPRFPEVSGHRNFSACLLYFKHVRSSLFDSFISPSADCECKTGILLAHTEIVEAWIALRVIPADRRNCLTSSISPSATG